MKMQQLNSMKTLIVFAFVLAIAACWASGSKARGDGTQSPSAVNHPTATPTPAPKASRDNSSPENRERQQDNKQMSKQNAFRANLPPDFTEPEDDAGRLLLREYGAVFVCRGGAKPPTRVVFKDAAEVDQFQRSLPSEKFVLGGYNLELQSAAVAALKRALLEAEKSGLKISPRGADSARRSYPQTVSLWASRVNPGLTYWTSKGRLTKKDADRIRSLSPYEQVPEILQLEKQGIYFSKDLSKSIIYSVAPPGTSQHLSMLALDVAEHENAAVRQILAKNGWFQTVVSDLPHFTFLGVGEEELPSLGLKRVESNGRVFWVPDI